MPWTELLPDNPAETDRLGVTSAVDILVSVVRATPPPFTIGIFGAWGSGKTTLMTLMRARLEEQGTRCVWFNAWKYDRKEVIWNALIQCIFYRMKEQEPAQPGPDFIKRLSEVARNLALFAARKAARFIPGDFVKADDVDEVVKAFRPLAATDEQFDFINKFEATFDRLVGEFVGQDGRLVVFVDDLDRCLPENAIEVLEAIKLYLDRSRVTFVVAADRAIVEEGIRHRYRDNRNLSAKEYLEKIVQLPFVMRGLGADRAQDLINALTKESGHAADQRMARLIIDGTDSNPRRIKRFVNTFYVLVRIAELAGRKLQDEERYRLAVVLLLQMRAPDIYEALTRHPFLLAQFAEVLAAGSEERERRFAGSPVMKLMYENDWLRRFIDSAKPVGLSENEMLPWAQLAAGGTSAEGGWSLPPHRDVSRRADSASGATAEAAG